MCYLSIKIMAAVNWDNTEKVIDQSCHTVTLTDDVIQNPKSFKNNNIHSPKKTRMLIFLKFSTFSFKISVEAPIFTGNKLYQDDRNY